MFTPVPIAVTTDTMFGAGPSTQPILIAECRMLW